MKIGITYDLRDECVSQGFSGEDCAEFDSAETIDAIESAIRKMGHETERIGNIINLTRMLANDWKWDMVFNICEGVHGIGREVQVPALLEAFNIPHVFSDSVTLALTTHKGYAKSIVRDNRIPTADFLVIENEEDICNITFDFPMFIKPIAEGTSKGISDKSVIRNESELIEQFKRLKKKFTQPLLVEKYLPGREFTVGILGSGKNARVVGVMEVVVKNSKEKVYSYFNKENYEEEVEYSNVEPDIESRCSLIALNAWKALNCLDGGRVDLRMDDEGVPNFIEVNPLPGLHPNHSDLSIIGRMAGLPYERLIEMIVESAIERKCREGY